MALKIITERWDNLLVQLCVRGTRREVLRYEVDYFAQYPPESYSTQITSRRPFKNGRIEIVISRMTNPIFA